MKILLTGGTGFIGRELIKHLTTHHLVMLTRSPSKAKSIVNHADMGNISYISSLDHLHDLNEFDAVINLAGEPIADKRWTKKQKKEICDSRWNLTERIVDLIHASTAPPLFSLVVPLWATMGTNKSIHLMRSCRFTMKGFRTKCARLGRT